MWLAEQNDRMDDRITDRVYGCLVGGAIGDALGAPVEGWTYDRIREEYGQLDTFKQYYMPYSSTGPGSITSDTTLRHYLCLAIAQEGGRITPEEFADVLYTHMNPDHMWVNEEIVLKKLSAGMDPWTAGRGAVPDNKIVSAITPIGLINAGDPRQAYQDGFVLGATCQEGHYRHASATVAAGIAEAITPGATADSVLETMVLRSTGVLERAIDLAMGFAEESTSVEDLVETLYDRFLDWRWPPVEWDREKYYKGELFSASALEVVPVAMALFAVCEGRVNDSIVAGVNYGRDSDSVATIAGSLAGTLHGAEEVRPEWRVQCEEANRDFFEELEGDPDADFQAMAGRIVDAIEGEREAAAERAEALDRALEGDADR